MKFHHSTVIGSVRTVISEYVQVLLPLGLFSVAVLGQTPTGQIVGIVTDPTGAAVVGAQIGLLNERTGENRICCQTDAEGGFLARALPVGRYTVTVEQPGFQKSVRSGLTVVSLSNVRVDIQLAIGDSKQTIEVTGDASLVETRSPTLANLIDGNRIIDLPLNGRNILNLAQTVPGVDRISLQNEGGFEQQKLNFNGLRSYSTNVQLDGTPMFYAHRGSTVILPPPDAIAEVQVVTSGVTAEYGRGAAVVSSVTKSGTNQFHGSAYEFFRNDKLDARNFFAPVRPKLRFNQFGGTLGGPIKKDKLFFFGSFQGFRTQREVLISSAFPPTQAERRGDLSRSAPVPPLDPLSGQPFPNAQIPTSRLDPVAQRLLERIPLPNQPTGVLAAVEPIPVTVNNTLVRLDYNISNSDRLAARYYLNPVRTRNPFPVSGGNPNNVPGYSPAPFRDDSTAITLTHTRTWSPSLVSTTRASLMRFVYYAENSVRIPMEELGARNFVNAGGPPRLPKLDVIGRFIASPAADSQRVGYVHDLAQDWSLIRGRHEIKWGGGFQRHQYYSLGNSSSSGIFGFTGDITRNGNTLNAMADFLLGTFSSVNQNAVAISNGSYWNPGFYLQDNFRWSRRLTINLGLRWEIYTPWWERDNKRATFIPGARSTVFPTALPGLIYQNDPQYNYRGDYVNLGPRVGFAYDLTGKGRTTMRGGYAVSFDYLHAEHAININQPFTFGSSLQAVGTLSNVYQRAPNPFPYIVDPNNARFITPGSAGNVFQNVRPMYNQNVSLTLQHQLGNDWLLQAGYVGNFSRKNQALNWMNLAPYIPGNNAQGQPISTPLNVNQRRPLWPTFGSITGISSDSNASYNGLQTMVRKRMSNGLTMTGTYVWSKAIDECTSEFQVCFIFNPNDRRYNRGRGDNDRRHSANITYVYELPFFRNSNNSFARQVLGGWQIAGMNTFQTGTPFRSWFFGLGVDTVMTGATLNRPDVTGNWRLPSDRPKAAKVARWFNPDAFGLPAPGNFGNTGKGVISIPGLIQWDVSVQKRFKLREGWNLEYRAEFFNVLNRANFGEPQGTWSARAVFGRITSTATDNRNTQMVLRLEF